jgi:hypothetical protein
MEFGRGREVFINILCVPLCPLWLQHLHFINHKGHKGTQGKKVANLKAGSELEEF